MSQVTKFKGAPTDDLRVVLYEGEQRLEDEPRFELLQGLLEAGHAVRRVAQGNGAAQTEGAFVALAVGAAPPGAKHQVDLGETSLETVREAVTTRREEVGLPTPGEWTPWFPVIDFQRCTNCMQCLSFCLFDVYGVDEEGKIEVRNEEKCKTACPACSRVCPDIAILFPKYGKGPINGDVVKEEDVANESMKVNISALLGGDIYAALKDRSSSAKKRFSTERDDSRALLERKRCLKELQETLDIPNEVLMTLPSAGQIEERAKKAKEKMERRRAISQTVQDETRQAETREEEWGI